MDVAGELERWRPRAGMLLPVLELEVAALTWQLDPHAAPTGDTDAATPLDVTFHGGRWVVLGSRDRLHRAVREKRTTVPARVVPPEALRQLAA